jgi:hypothetical protein
MTISRTTLLELIGTKPTKLDIVSAKADIMVMMLNGSINWNFGCHLRNRIDEEFKEI